LTKIKSVEKGRKLRWGAKGEKREQIRAMGTYCHHRKQQGFRV